MRTIETTFQTFGASVLLIGLRGENSATKILIDCADALAEYRGTMAAMSITGPDGTVYPGDISLDENGIVHWVVAARDCGIAGYGSARIDLVDDDGTVVASSEATTMVIKTKMQGVAPDQIANWTEAASVALQEVRAALLDLIDTDRSAIANEAARQLAETGRVSAETLRASAETARASAETARATAETARATAETARATAESTRASAETDRIAAETARVSEFSTIEANAQAALSYIGPSEASSTASAAHAAGSYFIYNGKLYQATDDIAIGDTITSGTNCAQVSGGAMGEVSDLKSVLSVLDYLSNEGVYVITSSDLESGYWGYSTKYANSKRLRIKYLIQVRKGMTVRYTNPTMKLFFGVLETPISSTYLQYTGWRDAGKINFIEQINFDGYMTFMVESTSDISVDDYDSVIEITTAQKQDADKTKKKVKLNSIRQEIPFALQGGRNSSTGEYVYAANRLTTRSLILPKGLYCAKVPENYELMIYKNGVLRGGDRNQIIFDASGEEEIYMVMRASDNSNITVDDADGCYYEIYDPAELTGSKLNGVNTIKFEEQMCDVFLTEFNRVGSSRIFKMPKSGINVERTELDDDSRTMAVMFFRMSNGMLVPATDYSYANIKWNGTTPTFMLTKNSIYYPYDDNLYFSFVFNAGVPENLYVSYGTVQDGNGRLTNLAPLSVKYGEMPEPNQNITDFYPSFTQYVGYGYSTQQHFYGSVIRLQDAKAICCSADLSMACWWYDNDGVLLGQLNGSSLSDYAITGLNYIDLSKYGTEGYCVIAIRSPSTAETPAQDATITKLNEPTMGVLHLYNYVLDNVFVQYYNRTIILHEAGLHPIIAHNIELIKKLDCGDSLEFNYRGPVSKLGLIMRAMKHVSPCFYASAMHYNTLFQCVSLKSYITALQNPNSQIYLVEIGGNTSRYGSFGMVCITLPPVLSGYEWSSRTFIPGNDFSENNPDFEYVTNWDYTKYPEKLKTGDWLIGKEMDDESGDNGHDGHALFITDAIRINGELICYEGMEAYPPYLKYRYIYMSSPLDKFNMEFSRSEPLGTYFNIIARPKDPSTFKTLEEAFGEPVVYYDEGDVEEEHPRIKYILPTDYSSLKNRTLMCDRGTDSVYGIGQNHCYITVNDDTMESFDVYKDGTITTTVDLSDVTWKEWTGHALKAVDIADIIHENGAGYYTLKPNNKDTAQESFYVGGIKEVHFNWPVSGETVDINIQDPEDVSYVTVMYFQENYDSDDPTRNKKTQLTFTKDKIVNGHLIVPAHATYWTDHTYTFNYCIVLYKAKHNDHVLGTYCVLRDEDTTLGGTPGTYVFTNENWGIRFPDT